MIESSQGDVGPRKPDGDAEHTMSVSLGPAFRVLMAIAEASEGASSASLAKATSLSTSTVRRSLRQLSTAGLAAPEPGGTYVLGPLSLQLGHKLRSSSSFERLAEPILRELVEVTSETAAINRYLPREGLAVIAAIAESPRQLSYQIDVGETKYLTTGASGKVILAYLTAEEIEHVLQRHGLPRLTKQTVPTRTLLDHDLEVIRSQGYGLSRGERIAGAVAVAAPVFASGNRILGSLVVTTPEQRFESARKDIFIQSVVSRAAILSDQIQHHDGVTSA